MKITAGDFEGEVQEGKVSIHYNLPNGTKISLQKAIPPEIKQKGKDTLGMLAAFLKSLEDGLEDKEQ